MTTDKAGATGRKTSTEGHAELPFEIDARDLPPLGMAPAAFLRDYWQKRPLLIRNAFPDYVSPIQPEDLAGLACEEGVLARIISHDRQQDGWSVQHGPFPEEAFPGMPDHDWTLLVQDVDKWDADIASLLEHFSFLPRWRLDDIMVSFAAPGGSVGAHVDQYDVFLLQALGHRRWQIDASAAMNGVEPPLAFRDDVELKLLQRFTPSHDWVLGPGDMLYLPPNVPHHGVAEDSCLTFSVGMRAPSAAELLGDFVDSLVADADDGLRYRDPDLKLPADPGEIDAAAMKRVTRALDLLRTSDPQRLGDWFGRFITVYRNAGEVMPPALAPGEAPRSRIEIEWDLQHGATLHRHPYSRMAWRKADKDAELYVNGESHPLPQVDASAIANAPIVDGGMYAALSDAGRECALTLLQAGHYRLALDGEDFGTDDDGEDLGA